MAAQLFDDFNLSRPFSRLTPESANELGQPPFGAWLGLLFRQTARGHLDLREITCLNHPRVPLAVIFDIGLSLLAVLVLLHRKA